MKSHEYMKIQMTKSQKSNVNKIKRKIKQLRNINPQLQIESIDIRNKQINLIQDGVLIAGTKQRVAELFAKRMIQEEKIKGNNIHTLIYVGTYNGYGAVATAFAAHRLNLKCIVFLTAVPIGNNDKTLAQDIIKSRQINTLLALKTNIILCNSYGLCKRKSYKLLDNDSGYYAIPMGINDDRDIMSTMMSEQMRKAMKGTVLQTVKKPRIWLVAGSGGIMMSINKSMDCILFVYLTGGGRYYERVMEYINNHDNIFIVNRDVQLPKTNNSYYNTVKNYDDQIIPYVEEFGQDGDFIWNVGSE